MSQESYEATGGEKDPGWRGSLVGLVVFILDATSGSVAAGAQELAVAVIVLVGVTGIVVSNLIERRPLDCESDQALAESYRKSFFLRIALTELAALVAFVAYFLAGGVWLYFLGGAFSAIGFARLAPTAGHLARHQDDLARAGCLRSLSGALRQLPFRST